MCAIAAAKYIGCEVDLFAKYDHQKEAGSKLGAGILEGLYDRVVDCVGTKETLDLFFEKMIIYLLRYPCNVQ